MDSRLYNTNMECPVCGKTFEVTKVKTKTCRVKRKDTDFCIIYNDLNPLFYDAVVCEHCGYSSLADKFDSITSREKKLIRENLSPKWRARKLNGERSIDHAIVGFKLVLLNLHTRNAKQSEIAKVCMRIAWMYRFKGDPEKENEFLGFACNSYINAYENEKFPFDKMDEYTCMYIIAELLRRLGNFSESIKWFGRLIGSSGARNNNALMDLAREQYQMAKDALEKMESQGA